MSRQGQTFVVKCMATLGSSMTDAYAPDGASFECDAAEALVRFDFLINCGKLGALVDGKAVVLVQIELATNEKPRGAFDGKTNVMLSQFVIDDEPAGPWANRKAAA